MNIPSGYTALDLIGFTDKGAYNSATSYVKNDLVSYNGEKWRCKLDDTVNHTPEEGTYWTIFIDAPSALDDLADVTISSVANGNILEYDSATSKWKNSTGLSEVKQALTDLTDLVEGATEITTKSFAPVIAVNDALPVNAVDVQCKIEPIQAGSGTPSPSNVRAISGRSEVTVTRAGKNLLNVSDKSSESAEYVFEKVIPLTPSGAYTLSLNLKIGSGQACALEFFKDTTLVASTTKITYNNANGGLYYITLTASSAFNKVRVYANGAYEAKNIQLEVGSEATSYEPYQGEAYTIQLGDTYYGGTLDVTTGVLTVDRIFKEYDGTETWTESASFSNTYYTAYPSGINTATAANVSYGMCNAYAYANPNISLETQDNVYLLGGALNIRDTVNGTSLSDWTNYVANHHLQFIFPLTTPFAVQLTPQEIQMLQGNNTIFTDSGDTSIQYYANGVKNLEASVSAIQNDTNDLKALTAIFGTFENGTTASKPYAQGDYFVKNNKMCKAKTSIAKGATFTLNTNYEEFTLAEILKTIETA